LAISLSEAAMDKVLKASYPQRRIRGLKAQGGEEKAARADMEEPESK